MKLAVFITMVLFAGFSSAQTSRDSSGRPVKAGYGETVQQTRPDYPGGPDSLRVFISRTMRYPHQAILDGARGKVWLGFTVDREGNIKDASVLKSVNPEIDQEALRILQQMPRWNPATIAGNPVDSQYMLQLQFVPPGEKP